MSIREACATAERIAASTLAASRTSSGTTYALASELADLLRHRRQRIGAPRGDHHVGAVPREELREVAAEAARGAGHERDASRQEVGLEQWAIPSEALLRASRSTNFWILPVAVLGSGPNTIVFGALKCAHALAAPRDEIGARRPPAHRA